MTKYYHTLKVNKHGVLATVFVVDSTRILAYFDSELVKHTSLKYVIFRTENFFSLAKEHFVINSQTQPHALIVHSFNGLVGWIRTKKLPKNLEINGLLATRSEIDLFVAPAEGIARCSATERASFKFFILRVSCL